MFLVILKVGYIWTTNINVFTSRFYKRGKYKTRDQMFIYFFKLLYYNAFASLNISNTHLFDIVLETKKLE